MSSSAATFIVFLSSIYGLFQLQLAECYEPRYCSLQRVEGNLVYIVVQEVRCAGLRTRFSDTNYQHSWSVGKPQRQLSELCVVDQYDFLPSFLCQVHWA